MMVDVDRYGLEALVRGSFCPYSVMDDPTVKRCGYYVGGFHDKWEWNSLDKLSDDELIYVYNLCKAAAHK